MEDGARSLLNRKNKSSISQVILDKSEIAWQDEFCFLKRGGRNCQNDVIGVEVAPRQGFWKVNCPGYPDYTHRGQLRPKTIATQDNFLPDNSYLGQPPPKTTAIRTTATPGVWLGGEHNTTPFLCFRLQLKVNTSLNTDKNQFEVLLKMSSLLCAFPRFFFRTTPLCRPDNSHLR